MKALLLSAGRGVRFQPQTLKYSKMVLPFLNVPIIGHPLKLLEDLGIEELVINTHYFPQQVEEEVLKLQPNVQKIHFCFEEKLLGGAGALKKNESLLQNENIIYLNGDSIFLCSDFFSQLQKQHQSHQALITFLVQKNKHKRDLWADSKGCLTQDHSLDSQSYFFTGFALFSPECLSLLKKEDMNIFLSLVQKFPKRCMVYVHEDLEFFEVGCLSSYLHSTRKCLEYLFQDHLKSRRLKEVILRYFPHFNAQTQLKCLDENIFLVGENVQGLENIQVKDFAVIEEGCHIKNPVLLEQSVLRSSYPVSEPRLFQNLFI